jgi:hypothetical protein
MSPLYPICWLKILRVFLFLLPTGKNMLARIDASPITYTGFMSQAQPKSGMKPVKGVRTRFLQKVLTSKTCKFLEGELQSYQDIKPDIVVHARSKNNMEKRAHILI